MYCTTFTFSLPRPHLSLGEPLGQAGGGEVAVSGESVRLPSLGAGVVSHTQSGEDAAQRGEGDREGRETEKGGGRERERGDREGRQWSH